MCNFKSSGRQKPARTSKSQTHGGATFGSSLSLVVVECLESVSFHMFLRVTATSSASPCLSMRGLLRNAFFESFEFHVRVPSAPSLI